MLVFTDDVYNGGDAEGDIDEVRRVIKGHIDAYAAHKRIQLAGKPSPEYAAWPLKLAEAKAGGGPMLQLEADTRGIPVEALISRVISNAQGYEQAEAIIAGSAGKHKDAVDALQTREELVVYDWRF